MDEQTRIVRDGYNLAAPHLSPELYGHAPDFCEPWLERLTAELRPGARTLDLGCGNGRPVCAWLTARGFQVTGVDLSPKQIALARQAVPGSELIEADIACIDFEPGAFDAIIALYSIIHVPLEDQPALLHRIARWLHPGSRLCATLGSEAWAGEERDWLGIEGVTMRFSHADAATYRAWLEDAGLEIESQEFVESGGGHELFFVRKPAR